ncbi:MAG: type II toxin-antitoxin system HicB family antitoxin [Anaerolineae bacterium]|nr:type II toxin-antitoxin system HicB family antitoxin [Anaerolineae bacterium]
MAEDTVKLTVRLPAWLHQALKERAVEYHVSLNQAVVDTLASELIIAPPAQETETERFDRMLRDSGLLADTGWMSDLAKELLDGKEPPSLEEVREWLAGIPLADWIIEDRGPR